MSSDEDATALMAAFKRGGTTRTGASKSKSASVAPPSRRSTPRRSPSRKSSPKKRTSIAVESFLSESSSEEDVVHAESPPKIRRVLQIRPAPVRNREEYTYYEPQDEVERILKEFSRKGRIAYRVRLEGGATKEVSDNRQHSEGISSCR